MKLALDAMGGDYAPVTNIDGALEAVHEYDDLSVVLVGDEKEIQSGLEERNYSGQRISVKHASQVVEMDESPLAALRRKKDSSIRIAIDLIKAGEADASANPWSHPGIDDVGANALLAIMRGKSQNIESMPTISGLRTFAAIAAPNHENP